jgi:hypothetical protein
LITTFFADDCIASGHGLGLLTRGCTNWKEVYPTVSLSDLRVEVDTNKNRFLIAAIGESFQPNEGWADDPYSHLADIFDVSRPEAKETYYEIIFRGCEAYNKVHA